MFADMWKTTNKTMASNYIGPTLDKLRGMTYDEFVVFALRPEVDANSKEMFLHLMKLDVPDCLDPPVENRLKARIFVLAYQIMVFPEQVATLGPYTTDMLQAPAQILFALFEKALADCKIERRPNREGYLAAFSAFFEVYKIWKPIGRQAITLRTKRALMILHDAGLPDTHPNVVMGRQTLVRLAGEEALAEFDAARNASSLSGLVPAADRA
jgi:hypothetical protein